MELRLYCFVNFYLSSIQQGIQTGHAAVDLVRKYTNRKGYASLYHRDMTEDWADAHKTFITLNGGPAAGIANATEIISKSGYPWVAFHEDEQSLGGIQTCVAVILPDCIFNTTRRIDLNDAEIFEWVSEDGNTGCVYNPADPAYELIKLLKSSRLAQ